MTRRFRSAVAAESAAENVWSVFASRRKRASHVENAPILLRFSGLPLTGPEGEDCYTFEGFASSPDEIRTAYYYHYKRKRIRLKEETRWS